MIDFGGLSPLAVAERFKPIQRDVNRRLGASSNPRNRTRICAGLPSDRHPYGDHLSSCDRGMEATLKVLRLQMLREVFLNRLPKIGLHALGRRVAFTRQKDQVESLVGFDQRVDHPHHRR